MLMQIKFIFYMKGFARGVNLETAYSELQSITDNNCPNSPKKRAFEMAGKANWGLKTI